MARGVRPESPVELLRRVVREERGVATLPYVILSLFCTTAVFRPDLIPPPLTGWLISSVCFSLKSSSSFRARRVSRSLPRELAAQSLAMAGTPDRPPSSPHRGSETPVKISVDARRYGLQCWCGRGNSASRVLPSAV